MEKQDDEQLFHEICLGNISLDGQRVNRPRRHSFTASLSYAVTFLCSLNFTLLLKRQSGAKNTGRGGGHDQKQASQLQLLSEHMEKENNPPLLCRAINQDEKLTT